MILCPLLAPVVLAEHRPRLMSYQTGSRVAGSRQKIQIMYKDRLVKSTLICGGEESEVGRGVGWHSEHTAGTLGIDAGGSFLYLVILVVPAQTGVDELIRLLHGYKVVAILFFLSQVPPCAFRWSRERLRAVMRVVERAQANNSTLDSRGRA